MAKAQPGAARLDSIEWLVADSDLVIVGKVTSLARIGPSDWPQVQLATVHVSQNLKGPKQHDLKIVVMSDFRSVAFAHVLANDKEALMFLKESPRVASSSGLADHLERYFAREQFAPRSFFESGWIIDLDPNAKIQTFTMAMEPLRGATALIAQAKMAVQDEPKGGLPCSHDVVFNLKTLNGQPIASFAGMGLGVVVPIDSRLERQAQKWALSPDPHDREVAVNALVYFKSGKNAKLLRHLASDAAESMQNGPLGNKPEKHFPVREAAQWLLKAWGEGHP